MKKTVLITGTSSGLGLETALLFAKQGFEVYASMRNLDKSKTLLQKAEAEDIKIHSLKMDVCDVESIHTGIEHVLKESGRIDILINNAGAGFAKPTEHASDDEMKWVLDTNLLSVMRTTKAVLPHMREQKSGHIINISSVGGLVGQPFNELYCAAKFGVEGFTEALTTYLTAHFGIHFTAVEPGGISTEFTNSAMQKTMGTEGLPQDGYLPIVQKYMGTRQARVEKGETQSFQTAEQVAQVVLQVAEDENPPIRIRTSDWAEELCHFKTDADPDGKIQNDKVIHQFLGD